MLELVWALLSPWFEAAVPRVCVRGGSGRQPQELCWRVWSASERVGGVLCKTWERGLDVLGVLF